MRKIPGILVVDNNVTLAGGGNVKILIDGKTTEYVDIKPVMKDLLASDIKKVDVIN